MRTCIISQYYPPDPGGAATRARNLCDSLTGSGHKVVVLTAQPHYPDGPSRHKLPQVSNEGEMVTVIRTPILPFAHSGAWRRFLLYSFFSITATWFALTKVRAARVVWCIAPNYLSFLPGFAMQMAHHTKTVLEVVDLWPQALITSGYVLSGIVAAIIQSFCNTCYRWSDCITTLTGDMSKSIRRTGIDASKIVIMPNAVDQMTIGLGRVSSRRPPHYEGKFVVMYSGNIGPIYDFDVILQAARKLVKDSKALFVIRGSGEGVPEITKRAQLLACSNTLLKFETSSRKEALQETAWADVCVLPLKKGYSGAASYPMKLLEYLALGKPVIALADGPIATLVSSAEAGLVLSPGDSDGLADSIARLQSDPDLLRQLGSNARKVSEDFAPEHFDRITSEVLNFVVGERS